MVYFYEVLFNWWIDEVVENNIGLKGNRENIRFWFCYQYEGKRRSRNKGLWKKKAKCHWRKEDTRSAQAGAGNWNFDRRIRPTVKPR